MAKSRWEWFHQLASPKSFYEKTTRWVPWLGFLAAGLLVVGAVWGLAIAPEDAKQGNSYRIIFIHVPAAFLALAGYYMMAIAGAIGLIWKMKLSFIAMRSAAVIGAALTFVSLFTGAVWGKPTWGTYWVWDARITSMLILFFLYLGVLALADAFERKESGNKASALLALVGTVNIPIIYKSVDWWNSLHQPATIKFTSAPSMDMSMFVPLMIMIAGFYAFYAYVLIKHMRAQSLQTERNKQWAKDTLLGE
ncbi:MAG: heme ABC transporter permease [Pseudomonadales bacterium]|jgi:heme exporter protein C